MNAATNANSDTTSFFDNDAYFEYLKEHCTDDNEEGATGRVTGLEQMRDFFELMDLRPDADVLEVGCGTGRVLKVLQRLYGVTAQGVDPCAEAIAFAKSELPDHANGLHHIADGRLTALPSQSFDRIIFWGVFELVDPRATLLEVSRLLRPGGKALLNNVRNKAFDPSDEDTAAALKAYREKQIPIWLTDIAAFQAMMSPLGLAVGKRAIFQKKADVVSNNIQWDGQSTTGFAEACYIVEKKGLSPFDGDVGRLAYA